MGRNTLQTQLKRVRQDLDLLYKFSTALTTTLKFDEILYITLTAIASPAGLGFSQAMLFLINEHSGHAEGRMAMGAEHAEHLHHMWGSTSSAPPGLEELLTGYTSYRRMSRARVDRVIRDIRIPVVEGGGVLADPMRTGTPIAIMDHSTRAKLTDALVEQLDLQRFVAVPLMGRNGPIGVLVANAGEEEADMTPNDVQLLMMIANQAGSAIENARLYEQMWRTAKTDALTRLWNHGYFQQALDAEIKRARRTSKPVSLAIFDLDHFKRYNDTLGHQAGDQVLRELSSTLQREARTTDIVARYAGEEFVCIFPQTNKMEAAIACERMRMAVDNSAFKGQAAMPGGSITMSCGVATFPDDAQEQSRLIYAADMALYAAKHAGRNVIAAATPSGLPLVAQRGRALVLD